MLYRPPPDLINDPATSTLVPHQPDSRMVIDNALIMPFDLSTLPTNVCMVLWDNGKGFIERNDSAFVRTNFSDPTPYMSYLNSAISILATQTPPIALDQAKQIKLDLCFDLYTAKRTAPITASVLVNFALTPHVWDASDAMTAMMQYWIGRDPTFTSATYWPVTLTPLDSPTPISIGSDLAFITDGIADRTKSLNNTLRSKQAAINALSTIADVVTYNVTAGW